MSFFFFSFKQKNLDRNQPGPPTKRSRNLFNKVPTSSVDWYKHLDTYEPALGLKSLCVPIRESRSLMKAIVQPGLDTWAPLLSARGTKAPVEWDTVCPAPPTRSSTLTCLLAKVVMPFTAGQRSVDGDNNRRVELTNFFKCAKGFQSLPLVHSLPFLECL